MVRRLVLACTFMLIQTNIFVGYGGAESLPDAEKRKIEALIQYVAAADTVKFVRNGTAYEAATAATFLRRKWQANHSAVHSAREFIEKIATASGTSGKPYLIRLTDGSEIKSRDFLLAQLDKIE
jgi:hypothetical protein